MMFADEEKNKNFLEFFYRKGRRERRENKNYKQRRTFNTKYTQITKKRMFYC